jgi:hypothetical protein
MTLLEFFGTASGAASAPVLAKIGLEWIRSRRSSFRPAPPVAPVVVDIPRRSYSPSAFAAVLDEKQAMRESLREQGEQTALLRQVVTGLEKVGDGVEKIGDKIVSTTRVLHEDIKTTRHDVRNDLQTLRVEVAMALGNEPPHTRQPTNPNITDPRRRDPR